MKIRKDQRTSPVLILHVASWKQSTPHCCCSATHVVQIILNFNILFLPSALCSFLISTKRAFSQFALVNLKYVFRHMPDVRFDAFYLVRNLFLTSGATHLIHTFTNAYMCTLVCLTSLLQNLIYFVLFYL